MRMVRHRLLFVFFVAVSALAPALNAAELNPSAQPPGDLRIWSSIPATNWQREALPIGNGRLGGMVFGGAAREQIQLNVDSLWIGDESDTGSYQTLGDLFVECENAGTVEEGSYVRSLDIHRSVHDVRYRQGGVNFHRTYFASHPAQVLVFRFDADQRGAYRGTIRLRDGHQGKITVGSDRITITGGLGRESYGKGSGRDRKEPYKISLQYETQLKVLHEGGSVKAVDGGIAFDGCDSLTLLLNADTDYLNQRERGWRGAHPHKRVTGQLEDAGRKTFEKLLDEHVRDYQQLFQRLTLDLGASDPAVASLSTPERIAAYREGGADPQLEVLLFQYARYLMISSSRPGALPANLQGLWNESNKPPWRCDYHTDVNVEMNYWFVDAANLSECFEPLGSWFQSIRSVRREETEKTFGTRGWITHAENGIFGGSTWKWSKGDAAWVAQNLWDHYAFTKDKEYLRAIAYPIFKELCEFWLDHLKRLPGGLLVSPDGFSPEHGPTEDGVSFDQQLVWDLFTNTIEASEALEQDREFREKLVSLRDELVGPKIGKWGQLQEWMVDRDNPKDQHRHLSHMIAVHPGRQISPLTTPDLAEAAKVSMTARGDGATGWSRAWKISIWARLHDGDHAYRILHSMLQQMIHDNLFNTHPPFQIDGNFGYAAGVCEMLVQSHMGIVHLLPALPAAWSEGAVQGLRVRGGGVLDMQWKSGKITQAVLTSQQGGSFKLRAPAGQELVGGQVITLKPGESRSIRLQ